VLDVWQSLAGQAVALRDLSRATGCKACKYITPTSHRNPSPRFYQGWRNRDRLDGNLNQGSDGDIIGIIWHGVEFPSNLRRIVIDHGH
jgi:hypothetical protein